jgi:hypothetical protein
MLGKDFWFVIRLIITIAKALLSMAPDSPDNPLNGDS